MIVARKKDDKYTTEITLADNIRSVYAGQPADLGGLGTDFRPGQLVLAGLSACISITIRQWLDNDKVAYEDVIVSTGMDNSVKGKTTFTVDIDIVSDIDNAKKEEYKERVKSCPVCNILANEKEFIYK